MGIVIDIIIAAVCIFTVYKAYCNGLVKSIMGFAKGIVSLVVAYAFTPALSEYFYDKFVLGHISGGIADSISSIAKTEGGTFNLDKMFAEKPDVLEQIISRYGADEEKLGEMCKGFTEGTEQTVESIADYIASPIASGISTAAAFILLFVGAFLVLSIVTFIIDALFHLPVLKGVNKLLGILFGVGEALVLCILLGYGAAMLMGYLGSLDPGLFGDKAIEGSVFMRMMQSLDLLDISEGIVK